MSERTIEQIIGWVAYDGMYEVAPGVLRTTEPTVDDLLAWLTGQGYAVKPQTILPGNITVEVWRGVNAVCQRTDRTLLAALELAVRAVAGES